MKESSSRFAHNELLTQEGKTTECALGSYVGDYITTDTGVRKITEIEICRDARGEIHHYAVHHDGGSYVTWKA